MFLPSFPPRALDITTTPSSPRIVAFLASFPVLSSTNGSSIILSSVGMISPSKSIKTGRPKWACTEPRREEDGSEVDEEGVREEESEPDEVQRAIKATSLGRGFEGEEEREEEGEGRVLTEEEDDEEVCEEAKLERAATTSKHISSL